MTFVAERAVETNPELVDLDVEYRRNRLVVRLSGRTISFSLDRDRQLARLETDTHQVEPSPTDIPDTILRHVLAAGYRLPVRGEREEDGEHTLWVGDSR